MSSRLSAIRYPLSAMVAVRKDFPEVTAKASTAVATASAGPVSIPIWRVRWRDKKRKKTYVAYQFAWRDIHGRHQEKRSDLVSAKSRATEVATSIANGEVTLLSFTQADRASLQRARELLPPGLAIEVAAGAHAETLKILQGRCTPQEAARYWLASHPAGVLSKDIPDIATEFLARRKMGAKWRRMLKKILERFSARFTGPFTSLQARDIDDWLESLVVGQRSPSAPRIGLRTRHNYRAAVESLAAYAKHRGYLDKAWDVMEHVEDFEVPEVDVKLYTPDELVRLLNKAETTAAGRKLVPLIAITAFAGVRHGEMNEEKIEHLDWADIDFEEKAITVPGPAAKTGRTRLADMPDNLIAWLTPYRRPSGKICPLANTSNALCRLRAKAGIRAENHEKRNALRKSFVTYKKALTSDIAAVADQAGNSPATIRKHYLRVDSQKKRDALRWFSIEPTRADVLPLFAWAKQ